MTTQPKKQRLDMALVERGLAPSREKARAMILAGDVRVAGQMERRASATVADQQTIEVARPPRFVGRGGEKLEHARQWSILLGGPITPPPVGKLKPVLMRESRDGHIAHLKRALPGDPRVRLAELIAREGDVLSVLITSGESRRPALIRFDEIPETYFACLGKYGPKVVNPVVEQLLSTDTKSLPKQVINSTAPTEAKPKRSGVSIWMILLGIFVIGLAAGMYVLVGPK